MKISRLGETCLSILVSPSKKEKVNILIDPPDSFKITEAQYGIVLLTKAQEKNVSTSRSSFLIDGPGEYEIKGISIQGVAVEPANEHGSTVYSIEAEQMRICYLGDFGEKELSEKQLETISSVDVLVVLISQTLSSKEMHKIISEIEPKLIIIPKNNQKKHDTKLEEFLKEMGVKTSEEKDQIVLKQKELKENGTEVVVLK